MNIKRWFDRLQEERLRLRQTTEAFAEVLGVSRSTVVHYESGKSEPSRASLERAREVGADVLYIISGSRIEAEIARGFDWDLLLEIVRGVDAWERKMDLQIPLEKKIALAKLLYRRFAASRVVSDEDIEESVRLLA
jgi:transcriptional regulator with XRE-family HTH domain